MPDNQQQTSPQPAPSIRRPDLDAYLRGEKLYGDDFDADEIRSWFADEEFGYFDLRASDTERYRYKYHALNELCGWRHLPSRPYPRILGLGSAYGEELRPIARRAGHIIILEPATGFAVTDIDGTPVTFARPRPDGLLDWPDDSFHLITCLGVLHHVPNVTTVVRELCRCLIPDGYILMREPVVSMGDWRRPRSGLTKRERGIPLEIFRSIILSSGLQIVRESNCVFSLTAHMRVFLRSPVYNSRAVVLVDRLLCRLPLWSHRYHPTNLFEKLRPTSVFFVLRKPPSAQP